MSIQTSDNETTPVTEGDLAAFAFGAENEPVEETADRARRVLTHALRDKDMRQQLLWLRSARAEWESEAQRAQEAASPAEAEAQRAEAARLSALQDRLRAATRRAAGLDAVYAARVNTIAESASPTLWRVWKTGGGRWIAGTAETARGLLNTVQKAGQGARSLILGGPRSTLSLPCLAPALAASATQTVSEAHTDAITTADGVRITFQQSPGSQNRMRVLVDASHMTPDGEADNRNGGATSRSPYNVAFLTLMEGDGAEAGEGEGHSRHLLVVTLNDQGKGYSDFSITPDDAAPSEADAQKTFPAPRAGGCRLVAATLSQMPPQAETIAGR